MYNEEKYKINLTSRRRWQEQEVKGKVVDGIMMEDMHEEWDRQQKKECYFTSHMKKVVQNVSENEANA